MATIVNFVDFLQDTFKNELYRNDAQSIIKKLTTNATAEPELAKNITKYSLPLYEITNRLFLYSFFLINLNVNILPYLNNKQLTVPNNSYHPLIQNTITELKTFIVPGDCKVLQHRLLHDLYKTLNIDTIIIEEGVEYIPADAFVNLTKLKAIYLPASLKSFGDMANCPDDVTIYYKPVLKPTGKHGVGFSIISFRENKQEWFKSHLKKY